MEIKIVTNEKKTYNSPEFKNLGKIGELTNTNSSGSTLGDGGTIPSSYTS